MATQKVTKYDKVEQQVAEVGTSAETVKFNDHVSAVDIAVDDKNSVGSPVHVEFGGTATVGSSFPVFDGTSVPFEVSVSKNSGVSLIYAGSPTDTATTYLVGYKSVEDLQK